MKIIEDRMGYLEVWKDDNTDTDQDSDLYLQIQNDIEVLKSCLSKEQIEDLENGYEVITLDHLGYF